MPAARSDTPNLMPQACERCWKRKQKCDRQKPCLQCRGAKTACIERHLGNSLDPSDPHAHHSYIESLKGRVRTLEARLQATSPTAAASSGPCNSSAGGSSATPAIQPLARRGEMQRSSSSISPGSQTTRPPPADALHDEMGYLPLSAMAEQWEQPFSNQHISFQTQVQAATCASGSNPSISNKQNTAIFGQLGDFHRSLLRQGLNLTTIETGEPFARFVELLKYAVPFLSHEQLTQDYQLVLQAYKESKVGDLITESPSKVIIVHLAVATGILLSKDYRYMESYATALALTSYQLVPRAIAFLCDLEAAQILTMMAIFSIYSSFGGSTWHLLDLATTRCIAAGLHNASVSGSDSDDTEKENNRRTFWSIYMLDAFVSFSLDRPFQIQDEDITTAPPSSTRERDESEQLQSWNVQHAMLLHAMRRDPSKGMLFHYSNYRYWRETAPVRDPQQQNVWIRKYHIQRMCCRNLVSILALAEESPSKKASPTITDHAEKEFTGFLETFEEQCRPEGCALTTFDSIDAFNAGVSLIYIMACRSPAPLTPDVMRAVTGVGHRVMRLLAAISERFTSVRSLYDILGAFTIACGDGAWAPVAALVENAELFPSQAVERLMRTTIEMISGTRGMGS